MKYKKNVDVLKSVIRRNWHTDNMSDRVEEFDTAIIGLSETDGGYIGVRPEFFGRLAPNAGKLLPEEMEKFLYGKNKYARRIGELLRKSDRLQFDEGEKFWRIV